MSHRCATSPKNTLDRTCECHYRPNVDVFEKADEIVILADLPGASPDSIQLDYEEGELSIQAHVEPRQDTDTVFQVREYGTGDYQRKFKLDEIVDVEQISATYTNGVLTVHLPKVQAAKPRRVEINVN